jgi:hypothetical protein
MEGHVMPTARDRAGALRLPARAAPARVLIGVVLSLIAVAARAYDPDIHQQLTFMAVKQFDRCIEGTTLDRLTPLEIRYIVRTNVSSVDAGFFRGLVSWRFYDRSEADDHSLLWIISTRMNQAFQDALDDLEEAEGFAERYANLGRMIGHIQDMSAPSYAVPVYYPRWWRLSFSDRFNSYPVNVDELERRLADSCDEFMNGPPRDPREILRSTADDTIDALKRPIEGMPATWEAFWEVGKSGEFGSFGPAGNSFGRRTEFDCNRSTCRLRDRDPRYIDFALGRHHQAVIATMQTMYWKQCRKRERMQESREGTYIAPATP